MVTKTIISKVGKIDFFAVLPSGTYCFLSLYIAFGIDHDEKTENLWQAIELLIEDVQHYPSTILLILFCIYLLGSILRAIQVSIPEKIFYGEDFPYDESIKSLFKTIKSHSEASDIDTKKIPMIDKGFSPDVYNYWKQVICIESPEGYSDYQEFEARTRYFAAMSLAGLTGFFLALGILLYTCDFSYSLAWQQLVVSIILFSIFGFELHRVRTQEVMRLTGLYLAYRQNKEISNSK
ncbi:hypothetical protein SG34_022605 [Thalassomonas viridans]|uniref:Uncharacterized protein n=1 Tax=Thalassomonas viridans TaxID=137584 RepID=A0AAF0C689_9GAMM|nr:hypothetical protein [Thalassomonas viridans]WDE04122.1 hypothetical protein SG34_022605 [Thalassomonas viridans]